jgi:hypothetical protein
MGIVKQIWTFAGIFVKTNQKYLKFDCLAPGTGERIEVRGNEYRCITTTSP